MIPKVIKSKAKLIKALSISLAFKVATTAAIITTTVLSNAVYAHNVDSTQQTMSPTMPTTPTVPTSSPLTNHEVMTILKPYYPIYNQTFNCQGVYVSYDNNEFGYCVEVDRQVLVNTDQGERLYVLVTGDQKFDGSGQPSLTGHVNSGLAGMFVLKRHEGGWQVESAKADISVGASGLGLHDWKLTKLGPNKWGFINVHTDMHQGMYWSKFVILTPQGRRIDDSWINNEFDDTGTGLCGGDDMRVCNEISAKLLLVDTSQVVNGFYPIKLQVNGTMNEETYHNAIFTSYYNVSRGYFEPYGYPTGNF